MVKHPSSPLRMSACTVRTLSLVHALATVVKTAHDSESARVRLVLRSGVLSLFCESPDGSTRSEVSVPVSGDAPDGAWLVGAAELRDALTYGRDRLRGEDTRIDGLVAGARNMEFTLAGGDSTQRAVIPCEGGPALPEIPAEGIPTALLAHPRHWALLGRFAGPKGLVRIYPDSRVAYAVAEDGSTMGIQMGASSSYAMLKDTRVSGEPIELTGLIVRQIAFAVDSVWQQRCDEETARFAAAKKAGHPLKSSEKEAVYQSAIPNVRFTPVRRPVPEAQTQTAAAVSPGTSDSGWRQMNLLGGDDAPAHIPSAEASESQITGFKSGRRTRPRPIYLDSFGFSDETIPMFEDPGYPESHLPPEPAYRVEIGAVTHWVPTRGASPREIREIDDHRDAKWRGGLLVDGAELAENLRWAVEAERAAVAAAPDAEAFLMMRNTAQGSARIATLRPNLEDAGGSGVEVRTQDVGGAVSLPAYASALPLLRVLDDAPNAALKVACDDGRRMLVSAKSGGIQIRPAAPTRASIMAREGNMLHSAANLRLRAARTLSYNVLSTREADIDEIRREDESRGQFPASLLKHSFAESDRSQRRPPRTPLTEGQHARDVDRVAAHFDAHSPTQNLEDLLLASEREDLSDDERQACFDLAVIGAMRFALGQARNAAHSIALEDRISLAYESLVLSAQNWSPDKGAGLLSYFKRLYNSALADSFGLLEGYQFSFSAGSSVTQISRTRAHLAKQLQRTPSVREIAEALGRITPSSTPEEIDRAIAFVSSRVEVLDSRYAPDLHRDAGRRTHLPTFGERIEDVLPAEPKQRDFAPPAPRDETLARVLGRLPVAESEVLSAQFGLDQSFRLDPQAYAAYSGIGYETVLKRSRGAQTHVAETVRSVFRP